MAFDSVYSIYAAILSNNTTPGNLQIDQVLNDSISSGLQHYVDPGADGNVYPVFRAVAKGEPKISITSCQLATLLGALGLTTLEIDEGTLDLYLAKSSNKSTGPDSGSVHSKLTIGEGLIIPESINVSNEPPGTMEVSVVPLSSNGLAEPIALTGSVALPGSLAFDEAFVCGPLTINGTAIGGIQSYTINFNPVTEVIWSDGGVFPTVVTVRRFEPTVSVSLKDKTLLDTLDLLHLERASTTKFYFKRVDKNGLRDADNATTHISVTVNEGYFALSEISRQAGSSADFSFEILPTYNGTNLPLVFATGVAIS